MWESLLSDFQGLLEGWGNSFIVFHPFQQTVISTACFGCSGHSCGIVRSRRLLLLLASCSAKAVRLRTGFDDVRLIGTSGQYRACGFTCTLRVWFRSCTNCFCRSGSTELDHSPVSKLSPVPRSHTDVQAPLPRSSKLTTFFSQSTPPDAGSYFDLFRRAHTSRGVLHSVAPTKMRGAKPSMESRLLHRNSLRRLGAK